MMGKPLSICETSVPAKVLAKSQSLRATSSGIVKDFGTAT